MCNFNYSSYSDVKYKARAYTYIPISTRSIYPIEIEDLKPHIKLDYIDTTQEEYINFLIAAAVDKAEHFTNRSFINRKWKTFRDFFTNFIVLKRGTNATLDSFKYINVDNNLVDVDSSLYYIAIKDPYSKIIFKGDCGFPQDIINQQNSIEIDFTAGYGVSKIDVPPMLRLILCQHVAWLYENKGNCPVDEIPAIVLNGYKKYRIENLSATTYL